MSEERKPNWCSRTFLAGAIWMVLVVAQTMSRHGDGWNTQLTLKVGACAFVWPLVAVILGFLVSRIPALQNWWVIGIGTMVSWLATLGLIAVVISLSIGPDPDPDYQTPDEMMEFFAANIARQFQREHGKELDYSIESIRFVESQLGGLSNSVDAKNPPQGTRESAIGYGAYIGEVIRRQRGGSWERDHPVGGEDSFPLNTSSNGTVFPVAWCWKRIVQGEADNVFVKTRIFVDGVQTNAVSAVPAIPAAKP
ncbi:MAG: hypothetical protein ACPGVU_03865 [Limisphaerales bacterium]